MEGSEADGITCQTYWKEEGDRETERVRSRESCTRV